MNVYCAMPLMCVLYLLLLVGTYMNVADDRVCDLLVCIDSLWGMLWVLFGECLSSAVN